MNHIAVFKTYGTIDMDGTHTLKWGGDVPPSVSGLWSPLEAPKKTTVPSPQFQPNLMYDGTEQGNFFDRSLDGRGPGPTLEGVKGQLTSHFFRIY